MDSKSNQTIMLCSKFHNKFLKGRCLDKDRGLQETEIYELVCFVRKKIDYFETFDIKSVSENSGTTFL